QGDQRRLDALLQEDIAGLLRITGGLDADTGQKRGLALIRRDIVTETIEAIIETLGRSWIEDGHGSRGPGDLEAAFRGGARLLKRGEEAASTADGIPRRFDIAGADRCRRTRHDNDRIVAVHVVYIDEGRTCRLIVHLDDA